MTNIQIDREVMLQNQIAAYVTKYTDTPTLQDRIRFLSDCRKREFDKKNPNYKLISEINLKIKEIRNEDKNLQILCVSCNSSKGNKTK